MASERYVCIHGHFYQPPRENPWLGEIERQDSARPYHDWNERIATECYRANTAARVLDERGRVADIVNNYSRISFNVGPTLLSWLERKDPETYQAILEADKQSRRRFSGHGSAMAQPYTHMIMPLASKRDKVTQVRWGLRDFERRFNRPAEGMWLPETAVDVETLETLAENGVRFTVLAQRQAKCIRKSGEKAWQDCGPGVDPTRPYRVWLPSGRALTIFFYDGPISLAVAFEGLLSSGESFARRILSGFSDSRQWDQLMNIATDGESYGHHHRFGDMALAYALRLIEEKKLARLTNYGEYLSRHHPSWEVQIAENTSWSCVHGIERWRSDCGCRAKAEWKQAWRAPLREALDWLRDSAGPLYETKAAGLLRDPWAARDAYIELVLDPCEKTAWSYFERFAPRRLDEGEVTRALELLELQRQLMLMYTSCGWFFDDISGIETVQVLQYAARAAELCEQLFGRPFHGELAQRLAEAPSNLSERKDGRLVYERLARAAAVTAKSVCAQVALESLFDEPADGPLYGWDLRREAFRRARSGKARLSVGRLALRSRSTLESHRFVFAALHLGGHVFHGGVQEFADTEEQRKLEESLGSLFDRGDLGGCMLLLRERFGAEGFSLQGLFRDAQHRIVSRLVESTLDEVLSLYRQLYEHHAPVLRFFKEQGLPAPRAIHAAAELTLHAGLRAELEKPEPSPPRIEELLEEAQRGGVRVEADELSALFQSFLERRTGALLGARDDPGAIEALASALRLSKKLPLGADVWKAQNAVFRLLRERRDARGRPLDPSRLKLYAEVAELLNLRLEPLHERRAAPAPMSYNKSL